MSVAFWAAIAAGNAREEAASSGVSKAVGQDVPKAAA